MKRRKAECTCGCVGGVFAIWSVEIQAELMYGK
jgi:hypothetical protein